MEGFGQKSAENLKNSIDKAKKNSLTRILTSLSIHHVGRKASSILAARIEHVFDLIEWEESDYTAIDGIGPVVAQNRSEERRVGKECRSRWWEEHNEEKRGRRRLK